MPDTSNNTKILLALSGGVDSSVCARILQQQGFEVEAVVIAFSPAHAAAVAAAKQAAGELDIPLDVLHCETRFDQCVVEPFCHSYARGETPNPCIHCNPGVKFAALLQEADRRNIHWIASGHYARVVERDGAFYPAVAQSTARDQSYMLYRLPQPVLSRLRLPVGEFEKDSIRSMARAFGLSSATAPDSQEICFIPDGDYAAFIEQRGIRGKTGRFIGPAGEDLGPHRGVVHYTVGQRRGIGLALGRPVFVKAIEANGDISLGWAGEEFSSGIHLDEVLTTDGRPLQAGEQYLVKIRSVAKAVPCVVTCPQHGQQATLRFNQLQRAAAPGQHAVLYRRDGMVLGGGRIAASFLEASTD